jgi:hypothetical protein
MGRDRGRERPAETGSSGERQGEAPPRQRRVKEIHVSISHDTDIHRQAVLISKRK